MDISTGGWVFISICGIIDPRFGFVILLLAIILS